jgi:hypothetical protein
LEHNEDFEATGEALHFFDALEDSRIATAHHGLQSHAVGGEPESTLRGLVSRGKEEISLSHGADNTQPAKVISATTQGRNLGVLNSCRVLDFTQGVKLLDSRHGEEEVFQGVKQPDAELKGDLAGLYFLYSRSRGKYQSSREYQFRGGWRSWIECTRHQRGQQN